MATAHEQTLSGWGRFPRSAAVIHEPEDFTSLRRVVQNTNTIARGLGRSYADQALNAKQHITICTALNRYLDFDANRGVLRCESGVSLAQIIHDFAPRGFFPLVTPGTKYVTVGGCIANDVHGKGHHVDGCFSRCVEQFRIMLADGSIATASRSENPDLFWANFGGMGLLGIILDATIRLRPIETTWFEQKVVTVANLEELLDAFETHEHEPYAVAWIDPLARGSKLGRGVLTMGRHASREVLPERLQSQALKISGGPKFSVPIDLPSFALNGLTAPILNKTLDVIQRNGAAFAHYEKFFYPLDSVGAWNRGYGKRGFTQYQFVVPLDGGRAAMTKILQKIAASDQMPFLNVLKKFGPEEGLLSFPMAGYTYAIDFPIHPGLAEFVHSLDEMVVEAGGRVYLGKDAYVRAETLERMYTKLDEWRNIKAKYDPNERFRSDLARRVGLVTS